MNPLVSKADGLEEVKTESETRVGTCPPKGVTMIFNNDGVPLYENMPDVVTEDEFIKWENSMFKKHGAITWVRNVLSRLNMLCHTRTVICVVPLPIATLLYASFDASEASMNPIPTEPLNPQPQGETTYPFDEGHKLLAEYYLEQIFLFSEMCLGRFFACATRCLSLSQHYPVLR